MMTSTAATIFAGYLFLASTTPVVEAPFRDRGAGMASAPVGYTEFCAREPDCDPRGFLHRRDLPETRPADESTQDMPALLPMLLKERWFGERTVTASAVPDGDAEKPRTARPVLLPMLLNDRWFRERTIAAAAIAPAASPPRVPHQERWFSDRIVTASAPGRTAEKHAASMPVRTPMHLKERWSRERTITAAAPAAGPAPVSMPHKERWFRDRMVTAVAPRTTHETHAAALLVRIPMLVKEHWFKSRVFVAAAAGPAPSPRYAGGAILPKGGGRQQIGKPYRVAGRWFTPREEPDYDVRGIASWYGSGFHRRMTSNGEWFDMEYFSAAHPTLPLPSYVKVTNIDNGSEIIVRVNDRGPFSGGRIIDVSKKCAEVLGFKDRGTANVRVQYVGAAPLDDGGSHLRAVNRELRRGTTFERVLAAADTAVGMLAAVDATPRHAF
jgi:rare lipoprotein A (peptidoglycan hydrolase)